MLTMIIRFAAWLPCAVAILVRLSEIGYKIEEADLSRLIQNALIVELG